ncbi:uncharacterized protein LOC133452223 [Cololabis saira]|uniref:uncharacterized protein LOC133452223 n=1 Tax=Cololabis saira TaxID=129043 RepID=UPI002AD43F11|nr:uncharacterized protein LOC133452223 [Cololabis saira]
MINSFKVNRKKNVQSQGESDKYEPSLSELRELREAVQMDLELFPRPSATPSRLPVKGLKNMRLSSEQSTDSLLGLRGAPPLCHLIPRPPSGPPPTHASPSRTHSLHRLTPISNKSHKHPTCNSKDTSGLASSPLSAKQKTVKSKPLSQHTVLLQEGHLDYNQTFRAEMRCRETTWTLARICSGSKRLVVQRLLQRQRQHMDDIRFHFLMVQSDSEQVAQAHSDLTMVSIFNLLERHRLQSFYNQFLQLGVKDEMDFLDGVTDEDLNNMGLSQVEKTRFSTMKNFIQKLRAPQRQVQAVAPVQKSLESFSIQYTYPKCPTPKHIKDMDPAQNTVEDLMLRICHFENVGINKGVCLYTADGMPLTDDPFFNTWSLKDRHIENGAMIYAIFTPKENLRASPIMPQPRFDQTSGTDVIRCHIMLKGDYELMLDLETDTMVTLRQKLSNASGVPAHVLHHKYVNLLICSL